MLGRSDFVGRVRTHAPHARVVAGMRVCYILMRTSVCMNVAPWTSISKHLFGFSVDNEQMFVMGCSQNERLFASGDVLNETPEGCGQHCSRTTQEAVPMTALLTAAHPEHIEEIEAPRPELRLVQGGRRRHAGNRRPAEAAGLAPTPRVAPRRVSPEVRRRRTLLALLGLGLVMLALPLGGSGGTSHITGSASAATATGGSYTVRPGDSLWSIAERLDPSGDPRPIVNKLAAELGTYQVIPGEQLTLP